MIIGGPNARRDFHMDPSDEFFYQLEGDMVLEYISGEGKRRRETIRQGDVFLPPDLKEFSNEPTGVAGVLEIKYRGEAASLLSRGAATVCSPGRKPGEDVVFEVKPRRG